MAFSETIRWFNPPTDTVLAPQWVSAALEDVQPGDLLLMPASQISSAALRRAFQRGAAVVLGLGELSLSDTAAPSGLVVGSIVGYSGELRQAQKLLLTMLVNQRAALMERGARLHTQLAQLEAEGKGLDGLVKAMAEISLRGILVQDKRGKPLAQQSSPALVGVWKDVMEHLKELNSLPGEMIDRKRAGSQPRLARQEIPGGLMRLVLPITVGEVARGYLSVIGFNGELDALDELVAEQGGMVCAIEMARNKAIRETEKRLKGDLLTAILQETLSPRDAALWLHNMGLDLNQAQIALRFAWDSPASPSRRRLETIINGELARHDLKAIVHPMASEVVCFCQAPSGEGRPDMPLALGQAVIEQANHEYQASPCRCGVGTPAIALNEWRTSFSRAGQALEMARRLDENQPLYYSDLSVYRLLLQIEHSPELIAFQDEILGSLLACEGVDELVHTLEAFFAHNGNLSQTAEALFIHRNTLIYRLERIGAITNLNLDKPENRLAVQLALHILRMTSPIRHPK